MHLEKLEEYAIDFVTQQKIHNLLQNSFGQFPEDRIFLKQVPTFRLLVWEKDVLIAQCAIVFRVISLDRKPFRIFGIMDLCVDKNYQNQKIGSKVLNKIETIAKANNIDFILLFGGTQDFYLQNGFQLVQNDCRWVLMKNYKTMGVMNREIPQTLLIKSISEEVWNEEVLLDLMGFIF
ncbi:MAG: GNAT family N-acetyltransferase [Saprospiraceae bacterium]